LGDNSNTRWAKLEFFAQVPAVGASFSYFSHTDSGSEIDRGMTLANGGKEAYIDLSEGSVPVVIDLPSISAYPYTGNKDLSGSGTAANGESDDVNFNLTYANHRIFGVTANANINGSNLGSIRRPDAPSDSSSINIATSGINIKTQSNLKSGDEVTWNTISEQYVYYAIPVSYMNKSGGQIGHYLDYYRFSTPGGLDATSSFTLVSGVSGSTYANSASFSEPYLIWRSDQTNSGNSVGYTVTFDLDKTE
jgi:hypothetical protein